MTKFLLLIFLILSITVVGQTNPDTSKIMKRYNFNSKPAYFLDSVYIDISKTFLDPENIRTIKVTKGTLFDSASKTVGKVFIFSKNVNHNWTILADFKTQKSHADTSLPKVYIIDGNLISDTSNVRLETSAIKSIDILNTAETKEICYEGRPKTVFIITDK